MQRCRGAAGLRVFLFVDLFIDFSAKFEEQGRRNDLVEQRRAEQASDDDDCSADEGSLSPSGRPRGPAAPGQYRCQGGDHHGCQSLQAATNNHLFAEDLALVLHQMDVMRDHHDAVAAYDADQRDKADPVSHRKALKR